MISKTFRLARNDIEWVLKKGSSLTTDLFIVRFLPELKAGNSRFAVIVSTKFAAKAVDRNRVKRRVYEAIRLNIKPDIKYKLALIPKKRILKSTYQEIEKDIKKLFSQLT